MGSGSNQGERYQGGGESMSGNLQDAQAILALASTEAARQFMQDGSDGSDPVTIATDLLAKMRELIPGATQQFAELQEQQSQGV